MDEWNRPDYPWEIKAATCLPTKGPGPISQPPVGLPEPDLSFRKKVSGFLEWSPGPPFRNNQRGINPACKSRDPSQPIRKKKPACPLFFRILLRLEEAPPAFVHLETRLQVVVRRTAFCEGTEQVINGFLSVSASCRTYGTPLGF